MNISINDKTGVGRIEVTTLKLPEYVKKPTGTYTCTGKILIAYYRDDDPDITDFIHIAIMNDDGSDFKDIYADVIPIHAKANGIRYMPYHDNTRVLLGDYVLECSPGIDTCEKADLIPVIYPWGLQDDPTVFKSWSEVIISPDNEQICWTILNNSFSGAVNAIGSLVREDNKYVIKDAQIISNHDTYSPNPERPGYVVPKMMRGGEVKQFVRGGTAISLAGGSKLALPDSTLQDLLSEDIVQITHMPGYDETTIFSPDEKLGLVMSTRGSHKTDCAILGLLPRPHAMFVTAKMINTIYLYSVAGVRHFRAGNIGPVLVEIDKSMKGGDYRGVVLNDPEKKWVYCSPMSWHPDGKKVIWPELLRGMSDCRIRIASLLDYEPCVTVPTQKTPKKIPYAIKEFSSLWSTPINSSIIKIAGKAKGEIENKREGNLTVSEYKQFSDDGVNVFNGWEKSELSPSEIVYEADLEMNGEQSGSMKCKLVFSAFSIVEPSRLIKDKSYGYAEYNGVRLNVYDMAD